jgi:hypothetical protein
MLEELYLFSAGSANDDKNKHLWVKGASLFIPQINELLKHIEYKFNILKIEDFLNDCEKLKEIFDKNMSDKANTHNYHIFYSHIFNKLGVNSNLNILEIGLGTNNPNLVSTMGVNGKPGASLYSFSEYLPNSNIYGADIDRNILFQTDKIKTYYVDQLNITTFFEISKNTNGIKFDLIIDDGLHSIGANFNTLLFALDNLNDNGWIVIEDIHILENWKVIDFIISSTKKYKTFIIKASRGNLYVINKI